ncbi:MAG: hypothetical protein L0Y71_02650 [Gemmataceae bacterium]|nr:hypothetical protein [Gemmataceae bacterium]
MAPEPFLVTPLRSCRDLVHARHLARKVAQLLKFTEIDAIGIAAGALAVALQARKTLGRAELCFTLADRQLSVHARSRRQQTASRSSRRQQTAAGSTLYVLQRALPLGDHPAGEDLAWLVQQVERLAPTTLEDEIFEQNQEVLSLLLALRGMPAMCEPGAYPWGASPSDEKPSNVNPPSAA